MERAFLKIYLIVYRVIIIQALISVWWCRIMSVQRKNLDCLIRDVKINKNEPKNHCFLKNSDFLRQKSYDNIFIRVVCHLYLIDYLQLYPIVLQKLSTLYQLQIVFRILFFELRFYPNRAPEVEAGLQKHAVTPWDSFACVNGEF